jgi:hypothetical protein
MQIEADSRNKNWKKIAKEKKKFFFNEKSSFGTMDDVQVCAAVVALLVFLTGKSESAASYSVLSEPTSDRLIPLMPQQVSITWILISAKKFSD